MVSKEREKCKRLCEAQLGRICSAYYEESFQCGLRKIFPSKMGIELRVVTGTWRMYKHVAAAMDGHDHFQIGLISFACWARNYAASKTRRTRKESHFVRPEGYSREEGVMYVHIILVNKL